MNWFRAWPWRWARGKAAPMRRASSPIRLSVELLEDRLAPSTTAPSAVSYQQWAQTTFKIDDTVKAPVVNTAAATTQPQNASFGSLIGLPSAFSNYAYRGQGEAVAVIDTGIDYNNPDLGGGFGPGHRVIAGYNFVNNTGNPMDDNGHGTAVASEIGGSNATYSGVAPDVNLIALKVLDSTGSGSYGAVQSALDWVVANQAKYNIVAINMSLGSGNYTVNPYTFLDSDLTALVGKGVFISVAAGNDYYTYNSQQGLAFPAVDPNVVSVGAVYDANYGSVAWASGARDYTTGPDIITSFSQRSSALSILAPGAMITTDYLNDTFESMAGTSMAAPVIAGAAAILHQAMQANGLAANQSTILKDMQTTGVTVVDGSNENNNVTHTGLSFQRINLAGALNAIQKPAAGPSLQPIANQTVAPGGSIKLTLTGSEPGGAALTYTAAILNSASSQAYQLRTQLGLKYMGSYYLNAFGSNEKWLSSASGTWYCILPTGAVYRFTGSMATTLVAANLVATLNPSYYADPSLLWNAQAPAQPTATVSGNQLTIQAPANGSGSYQIQVTASDGKLSASQTFTLTIQNATPTTTAPKVANQSMLNNRSLTVTLPAQTNSATYSATITGTFTVPPASLAISGNQLTIYSSPNFTGAFTVQLTTSSGGQSASSTFQVTVTASAVAKILTADFAGTGHQDTAFFNQDGSWWVSVPQANGTFVNQNWGTWAAPSNWKSIQVGDFNGDGKLDVIGFKNDGSWWVGASTGSAFTTSLKAQWSPASNWSYVGVADVTGDGKADIVGFNNNGAWWVGASTGSTFATPTLWAQWSAASGWSNVQIMDVTGNGQFDIVGYNTAMKKWFVGYTTGKSFTVQVWTASTPPTNHA